MFSKGVVRSRKKIIKGLLSRAFDRGGQAERDKMQLLIDWRLAACRHANRRAYQEFSQNFKLDDMRNIVSTGSRGLDAFNWMATIEGRNYTLVDAEFEKRIKEMQRMHHISRFFKNSEIKVDLELLNKKAYLSNPQSPIYVDLPNMQLCQRGPDDFVHTKFANEPSYMSPLGSKNNEKGNTPSVLLKTSKPKFH